MRKSSDCIIIGAGIIGSCVALELARSGAGFKKITVIDAHGHAGGGTTSYSSGIIRTFYSVPELVRLSKECFVCWNNFADYLQLGGSSSNADDIVSLRKSPGWLPPSMDKEFVRNFLRAAKEIDIRVQQLDAHETRKLATRMGWENLEHKYTSLRYMDTESLGGGGGSGHLKDFDQPPEGVYATEAELSSVVVPDTGFISDPQQATRNVARAAKQLGNVEFMFKTRVVGIEQKAGAITGVRVVPASSSSGNGNNDENQQGGGGDFIEAPIVINCAGPYSSTVHSMAFNNNSKNASGVADDSTITTRPLRAECAVIASPALDEEAQNYVQMCTDCGFYARPEGKNRILIGGLDLPTDKTLDEAFLPNGAKDLPEFERSARLGDQAMLHLARASLRMPKLNIPSSTSGMRGVVATYDVSTDWTPIIDGSAIAGFYEAIGTSGNCFKVAPQIGLLMKHLVVQHKTKPGQAASVNKELVLPLTKQKFDASVFARNRQPLADSSVSVLG